MRISLQRRLVTACLFAPVPGFSSSAVAGLDASLLEGLFSGAIKP